MSISTPSSSASASTSGSENELASSASSDEQDRLGDVDRGQHGAQRALVDVRRQDGGDERRQELRGDEQRGRGERVLRLPVDEQRERDEPDVVADRVRRVGERAAGRTPARAAVRDWCPMRREAIARVSRSSAFGASVWFPARYRSELLLPITGAVTRNERGLVVGAERASGRVGRRRRRCSRSAEDWQPLSAVRACCSASRSSARRSAWRPSASTSRPRSSRIVLAHDAARPGAGRGAGRPRRWSSATAGSAQSVALAARNLSTYAFFPLVGGVAVRRSSAARRCSTTNAVRLHPARLRALPGDERPELPAHRDRLRGRRRAGRSGRSLRDVYLPVAPGRVRDGPAHRRRRLRLPGRATSAPSALLAVIGLVFQYLLRTALSSIERKEQLEGRTRELAVAPGRPARHRAPDALAARQDDRAPLGRGRPLLAGDRPRARASTTASRTSSTPPRCCTTSASSSSPTRSSSPPRS